MSDAAALRRKASLALGIALVCLVFLLETWVAHQRLPNAASPLVWGGLGTVAAVALVGWWRWRTMARRLTRSTAPESR